MGDEWTNIEWDGKIGADGKLNVEVDISTIPASVKSAQIQIWWCDDENGEMTVYNFKSAEVVEPTTEPTTAPTTAEPQPTEPTTAPTEPAVPAKTYGDANNDGTVTIADATAILQAIGNADKYALSEQGTANADVNGETGLTVDDAIVIMKVDAKLLEASALPLKA